jgi:ribosomal protein S18
MEYFDQEVKSQYDEMIDKERDLKRQIAELGKKIKLLRSYLTETGLIEKRPKTQKSKSAH